MSRYLSGSLIAAACLIQLSAAPTPAAAESSVTPVQADSFSRDELVCALNPQCGGERAMIRHRGLVPDNPGTEPGRSAPPFFNSITFDFNSSNLTPQARATLDRIGDALRDPTISDVKLKVEGHTDAKGTVPYNQTLSEKRANAVRTYLVENFGINRDRLQAVGYGKTQLLPNPPADSPYSGINRRVQFGWVNH